jgi:hypothetical protein
MIDFHSTQIFSLKKAANCMNFAAAGLSFAGHIITHSIEMRTNTR